MGVPHVTSFCCCMGLEMGAKFVGFVHLILALSVMVMCSLFAAGANEYKGTVEDAEDHLYSTWYVIAVVVACVSVVHVLLAATLLVSVYKRFTGGIRAWVWVMVALYAASIVYIIVAAATYGLSSSGSDIFLSFLEGVLFFAVLAYCILGVNSYYLMLKSAEDMEGPNKVDY
ncbi:hypothetical protein ABMA28_004235 [Loxostege sticticalis]|uniref:MARVEL domain-containing protein n=1 Tax=Loxostege sticticalis TaxID=481309 RepID=A0ABD0SUQ0_LOXSC